MAFSMPLPSDVGTFQTPRYYLRAESGDELKLEYEVMRTVERCDEIMSSPDFELPMLPSVAAELLQLLQEPDVQLYKVCRLVTTDPVVTAKVLKLANSAIFSPNMRITTIPEAITRLGLNQLRDLVVCVGLHTTLFGDPRLKLLGFRIWTHAVECAVVSDALARQCDGGPVAAFLPGLLHDIGQVPALLFVQRAAAKLAHVRQSFLLDLVERVHLRTGLALLTQWKLPNEVHLAITAHQAPCHDLRDLAPYATLRFRDCDDETRAKLLRCLGAVVLADRLLALAGFSAEPAPVELLGSPLALYFNVVDLDPQRFRESIRGHIEHAALLSNL
ncbi:MAG: HDOD domain-containing protein [Planctomycetes bacterium]|nr:HDOD domain-containing protein [Planctomycetota bacterium]